MIMKNLNELVSPEGAFKKWYAPCKELKLQKRRLSAAWRWTTCQKLPDSGLGCI